MENYEKELEAIKSDDTLQQEMIDSLTAELDEEVRKPEGIVVSVQENPTEKKEVKKKKKKVKPIHEAIKEEEIKQREKLPSGMCLAFGEKLVASYRAFKTVDTKLQGYVYVTNRRLIIEENKTSEIPINSVVGIKYNTARHIRFGMIVMALLFIIGAAVCGIFFNSIDKWTKWLLLAGTVIFGIIGLIMIIKSVLHDFSFSVYCKECEYFEKYKSYKKIDDKSSVEQVVRVRSSADSIKMKNELGAIIQEIKDGLYN